MSSTVINVALPEPSCFTFFDNEALNYYLPEIRCITGLKVIALDDCEDGEFYVSVNTDAKSESTCFAFTVYLTTGLDVQFGFLTYEEGRAARNDLILKLSEFVGQDQMVYSSGIEAEITVKYAVEGMTEIFKKDRKSCFSIIVKDVPFPLHLIFDDALTAAAHHRNISNAIEQRQRRDSMIFKKVAVG